MSSAATNFYIKKTNLKNHFTYFEASSTHDQKKGKESGDGGGRNTTTVHKRPIQSQNKADKSSVGTPVKHELILIFFFLLINFLKNYIFHRTLG